jgi:hypothetical protein
MSKQISLPSIETDLNVNAICEFLEMQFASTLSRINYSDPGYISVQKKAVDAVRNYIVVIVVLIRRLLRFARNDTAYNIDL